MTIALSEDIINYEVVNLANLNIYSNLRQELWLKVLETPELHDCKIEVLDSACPICKKFIDSEDKSCKYCKVEFTSKPVKIFKKVTAPGKGRKYCPGCELYVAVRTFICDCGWDFKKKVQTDNKKIVQNGAVQNIKKKKAEEYSIKEILDHELLVKNDRIRSNYLKVKNYITQNNLNCEEISNLCKNLITKRNQILNFNYKLVLEYVNKFYPKSGCKHLKKEDLISTGNLGLINAIDHFDETRKVDPKKNDGKDKYVSFSTYAHFWIKKEIIDEINSKEKDIRIPEHIINIYRTFLNYYNNFKINNEREPSLEEVMVSNNVKEKSAAGLIFAKEYRSAGGISIDEVNRYSDSETESKKVTGYTNLKFNNGSLDTFRLTDSIQEENFELSKLNWNKIPFRNEKYKNVFFALKGICGYSEMTIDEISKHFVISKLTITKIGRETIEKIRDLLGIQLVEVEEQEK